MALGSPEAHGQPFPLSLSWTAPEECPTEQDVRKRVDELLGAPADQVLKEPMAVRAEIAHGDRWRLNLESAEGARRGNRELVGDSCEEVALAAALVVALSIDPDAARRHANDPGAVAAFADLPPPTVESVLPPPEPARPAPAPAPRAPPPRRPAETAPVPSRTAIFISGTAALGVLPNLAPGFGGGAAYHWGPLRFEGAVFFWPSQLAEARENQEKGVRLELVAGRLSVCYRMEMGRVEPGSCGEFDAGGLHGEGVGFVQNRTSTEPWLALGAGPRIAYWPAEPLGITARLDAVVPLGRPRFRYFQSDGTPEIVHRPSPVGASAELGFEVALP